MKDRIDIPVFTWFLIGALLFSVFTFLLGIWVCANAHRDDQSLGEPVPMMTDSGTIVETTAETPIVETDESEMPDPMADLEPVETDRQETATKTTKPDTTPSRTPAPTKTENKPVEKKPEPAASTTDKTYYIQLTATPVEKAAREMKQKFERKGYNVYLLEVMNNGQKLYKVRIGVFSSRDQARSIAEKIRKEDKIKPWIVAM